MSLSWPFKDPDEVLDYKIEWSSRLSGDTISTSIWVVPSGITQVTNTNDSNSTTIWLSGGTNGATYDILNRIETSGGRTMDQTVKLKIKSK